MNVLTNLSLGVRLSLGDRRHAAPRLLLTGAAVALAVGLLMGTLGIFTAESARNRRAEARAMVSIEQGDPVPDDHLLVGFSGVGRFRGVDIETEYVAAIGDRPPAPPWLDRIPGPGQMAVSPGLRDLLASSKATLLRPRYPGPIIQVLDAKWLIRPGELVAYIGALPEELRRTDHEVITAFGAAAFARVHGLAQEGDGVLAERLEDPLFQTVLLISIGLLVPIAVLIATATRLSASAREARLAAVRLVGATPRQVRVAASVESMVAATIGCALGVALFFAGRPILASIAPDEHAWFASDIAPSVAASEG